MNRKEVIRKEAAERYKDSDFRVPNMYCFIEGAEWADKNPCPEWHRFSECVPEKGQVIIYAVIEADFKIASYQLMQYNPLLPMPQGDNVIKFDFDVLTEGKRKVYSIERTIKKKSGVHKASLFEDGVCIADNASTVTKKITDILGVDAEDFRKCIALPQGEFSQFEVNRDNQELKDKVTLSQKYIMWGMIALSAIAVIVLVYIFAVRNPGIKSADEAVGQADFTLAQGNDSLALAQYQQVANEYGYDAGNRATLMAATLLFQKGEYQQALDQLKNYDAKEAIVGAAAYSLEGDCYVNLQKYPEALKSYDKAISQSDDNQLYTPLFMLKKATVLREQKDYKAELKVLEAIKAKYPNYGNAYRLDIDKYIARAKYQAGE